MVITVVAVDTLLIKENIKVKSGEKYQCIPVMPVSEQQMHNKERAKDYNAHNFKKIKCT